MCDLSALLLCVVKRSKSKRARGVDGQVSNTFAVLSLSLVMGDRRPLGSRFQDTCRQTREGT